MQSFKPEPQTNKLCSSGFYFYGKILLIVTKHEGVQTDAGGAMEWFTE